ncbi:MAG: SelT/SelW/SelH family protein [Gemmatimonadales bacterium]|nr:SelT/SelW/SelH family protein [Gemmatimonadales bacterium]
MAAELEQAYPDVQIKLIESSGGVFEVAVDGRPVFSKKASRRHAEPGEVLQAVQQLRGGE